MDCLAFEQEILAESYVQSMPESCHSSSSFPLSLNTVSYSTCIPSNTYSKLSSSFSSTIPNGVIQSNEDIRPNNNNISINDLEKKVRQDENLVKSEF